MAYDNEKEDHFMGETPDSAICKNRWYDEEMCQECCHWNKDDGWCGIMGPDEYRRDEE